MSAIRRGEQHFPIHLFDIIMLPANQTYYNGTSLKQAQQQALSLL